MKRRFFGDMPMFLSIEQLAERWGVSVRTVERMIKSRKVARTRIGGSVRIPIKAIEDYEAMNTRPAKNAIAGPRGSVSD